MTELITIDSILEYLEDAVKQKMELPPTKWIDASVALNVLLGDEHDKLFYLQKKIAQERVKLLESDENHNVSAVKMKIESTDEYEEMQKQYAKIKRIEEFIRITKIRAKLKNDEMRGY